MVDSVSPYEEAKIRILNASHSCIAWAGTLAGLHYIHEGTHGRDHPAHGLRLRHGRCHPLPRPPGAAESGRPAGLPRRGARALRQSRDPRHQPAGGDGRLLEDPGLHRADGARAPGARRAIASVAMLPALFLAFLQRWHAGTPALRLPGPGHGRRRSRMRSARAADPVAALWRPTAACGATPPATRGWSMRCATPTARVQRFIAGSTP